MLSKLLSLPIRILTLLVSLYILGISAYHVHQTRPRPPKTLYAVTVISGVGALWSLLSLLLITFTPLLALIGDLILTGGFVAISVLLRANVHTKCRGNRDCILDKAGFSVAVANAVLFFVLALLAASAYRKHRKNRAFGPAGRDTGHSAAAAATMTGDPSYGGERWSTEMSDTAAFTRSSHHRNPRGVEPVGEYREPAARGGFDPELGVQREKEYTAF